MWLAAGCPRCSAPVTESRAGWGCPEHGSVPPLWRPTQASYDAFGEHLHASDHFPTYLPWPLGPEWRISDFGVVGGGSSPPVLATLCCGSGTSDLDGPVDVVVVAEEPGTGLGGRCAGLPGPDPGPEVGLGPPAVRVRVEGQPVALWAVSTSTADASFDRSVFVGEAFGRWLWLVLRPASAALLLREEWILQDVSRVGPPLVEVTFGGPAPGW